MVTLFVISDSQKLCGSASVANSIGCAVSANRDTVSTSPSLFFRHFAGWATFIFGWVGGQRQLLATYANGSTPVNASIASLKKILKQCVKFTTYNKANLSHFWVPLSYLCFKKRPTAQSTCCLKMSHCTSKKDSFPWKCMVVHLKTHFSTGAQLQ